MESSHAVVKHLKSSDVVYESLDSISTTLTGLETAIKELKQQTAMLLKQPSSACSTDLLLDVARNANSEFFKPFNARMAESFCRIEERINEHQNEVLALNTTDKCPSDAIYEILDEVKALSAKSTAENTACIRNTVTIADELKQILQPEHQSVTSNTIPVTTNTEPSAGWRIKNPK